MHSFEDLQNHADKFGFYKEHSELINKHVNITPNEKFRSDIITAKMQSLECIDLQMFLEQAVRLTTDRRREGLTEACEALNSRFTYLSQMIKPLPDIVNDVGYDPANYNNPPDEIILKAMQLYQTVISAIYIKEVCKYFFTRNILFSWHLQFHDFEGKIAMPRKNNTYIYTHNNYALSLNTFCQIWEIFKVMIDCSKEKSEMLVCYEKNDRHYPKFMKSMIMNAIDGVDPETVKEIMNNSLNAHIFAIERNLRLILEVIRAILECDNPRMIEKIFMSYLLPAERINIQSLFDV
jgi:hypothetical protein